MFEEKQFALLPLTPPRPDVKPTIALQLGSLSRGERK
jgi:hypothetical protein